MLMQKILHWTSGWVAGFILGLVIITFAVWGVNFSDHNAIPNVGHVNDEEITLRQFQRAYSNMREQTRQYMGTSALTSEQEKQLEKRVLDTLVESKVLAQATAGYGLDISNKKLQSSIQEMEVFIGEDGFDIDLYKSRIIGAGIDIATFEQQVRLESLSKQFREAVENSAFVLEQESIRLTKIDKQTRDLQSILLLADALKDSITVESSAVEEFYNSTDSGLYHPEKIKVAYIDLSVENLATEVIVEEDSLLTYYADNKDKYDQEEQRKLHMLDIKLAPDATDELVSKVMKEATELRDNILKGASFTEIAEQYNNKDLEILVTEHGYTAKGVLPVEIDEKVFAIAEGELSPVEKTEKGLHIFRVSGIKGGSKNTFEHVQESVTNDYKELQAKNKYYDLADQLVTLAYEQPDTLEVASEVIGVSVQESDLFSREDVSGVLADPKVLATAFLKENIKSGRNSEAIEISDSHLVVLRVLEHIVPEKKQLADVEQEIIEKIQVERASEMQREKGLGILAQLKQGKDIAEVAEMFDFEWTDSTAVARNDVSVNRKILREAFKLTKHANSLPAFGSTEIGKEDYAVFVVKNVSIPEELVDEDMDQSKATLQQSVVFSEWASIVDELIEQADITINSEYSSL